MSRSDILISIYPKHVTNIANRTKTHEFRNYLIPHSVERFWIYTTAPVSAVTHVATVSHGKRPGELGGATGLKCSEFERGDMGLNAHAYEILVLEELVAPVPLAELKRQGWVRGAPQKYAWMVEGMVQAIEDGELERRVVFDLREEAEAKKAA